MSDRIDEMKPLSREEVRDWAERNKERKVNMWGEPLTQPGFALAVLNLLGTVEDAQDAIYVLAGCVAKEREENDRLQARLQRAEKSLDEAAHALLNRGQQ